jgi:hypothetical protein
MPITAYTMLIGVIAISGIGDSGIQTVDSSCILRVSLEGCDRRDGV